ncbi:MAG: hypothetical protein ACKVHE_36115, partial [Planctomycetales bacterium]
GTSGFILNGAANYDVAGTSVNITGDINGDGFEDVVVGAPTKSSGSVVPGATNGQAYVMFGRSNISASVPGNLEGLTLDGTIGFKLSGSGSYHAGQRVTSGADLNGDGFDELFIGEPYSSLGTVTVFFGTDFDLNDGNAGDGELGNGLQKIDGSGDGSLLANAGAGNADILVGGGGDDTLTSDGGSDVLIGGSGDDILTANLSNFSNVPRFDGGTGVDTLTGDGSFNGANINLTTLPGNRFNDIEVIDLEDATTQTLTLDLATVLAITGAGPTTASSSPFATNDAHTLAILRDSDDVINGIVDGVNGWTKGTNETIDGETFEVFTQGGATVKIQSAITVTGDVNDDGLYTFTDGILIALIKLASDDATINVQKGVTSLTPQKIRDNVALLEATGNLDVNGDGLTTFTDGILVALVKLASNDATINVQKGVTSLTPAQIRTNVNALAPPAARPASPSPGTLTDLSGNDSEPVSPEFPEFQAAPPAPLLVTAESFTPNATLGDDLPSTKPGTGTDEVVPDEAFVAIQLDITMNLLS